MKTFLERIIPTSCVICTLPAKSQVCMDCMEELPWLHKACQFCAVKLTTEYDFNICGVCLANPPPIAHNLTLFQYQFPIPSLITKLKFGRNLLYANALGNLLASRIQHEQQESEYLLPDLILPVPLHYKRLLTRGYNQALEIARPLKKILHLPIEYRLIERIKPTAPQTLIEVSQRKNNLTNAFALNANITAQHIAIVDDVITTLSTVKTLATFLQKNGVKRVDVWCIARAGS